MATPITANQSMAVAIMLLVAMTFYAYYKLTKLEEQIIDLKKTLVERVKNGTTKIVTEKKVEEKNNNSDASE